MTTQEIKEKAREMYEGAKGFPFEDKPFTALDAEEMAVHFYNEAFDECSLKINEKLEGVRTTYFVGCFPISCFVYSSVEKRFYTKDITLGVWGLKFDTEKEAKSECIQICNEFINKLKQK